MGFQQNQDFALEKVEFEFEFARGDLEAPELFDDNFPLSQDVFGEIDKPEGAIAELLDAAQAGRVYEIVTIGLEVSESPPARSGASSGISMPRESTRRTIRN